MKHPFDDARCPNCCGKLTTPEYYDGVYDCEECGIWIREEDAVYDDDYNDPKSTSEGEQS